MITSQERLSGTEELELVRKYHTMKEPNIKKHTLDKLVLSNIGLVHKVVNKFPMRGTSCSYEDLINEGVAGLIHGINKFDITRGYRLSTYVYPWIAQYVRRYYHNHGRAIRIPVNLAEKKATLVKGIQTLTNELGREPTQQEILEVYPDADYLSGLMLSTYSLNKLVSENDELECLQGEDKTELIFDNIDVEVLLSKVRDDISDRDYQIIVHRFGLNGVAEHTLSELSDEFELTRARIHQIEKTVLGKLQRLVSV